MTAVALALHAGALLLLAHAAWRLTAARRAFTRHGATLDRLQERTQHLDTRVATGVREIMAQALHAQGASLARIRFADVDQALPMVFSTDSAFVLGKAVGSEIASACYGEGTCGLCLVEIVEGLEHVDPPSENELTLLRTHGDIRPAFRLACHLRPRGDITVVPRPY